MFYYRLTVREGRPNDTATRAVEHFREYGNPAEVGEDVGTMLARQNVREVDVRKIPQQWFIRATRGGE